MTTVADPGTVLICGNHFDGRSDALSGPAEILVRDGMIGFGTNCRINSRTRSAEPARRCTRPARRHAGRIPAPAALWSYQHLITLTRA
jgi:hypothetical protein